MEVPRGFISEQPDSYLNLYTKQLNLCSLQDHKNLPQALTAVDACVRGASQRWEFQGYLLPMRTVFYCVKGAPQQ